MAVNGGRGQTPLPSLAAGGVTTHYPLINARFQKGDKRELETNRSLLYTLGREGGVDTCYQTASLYDRNSVCGGYNFAFLWHTWPGGRDR